MDRANFLLSWGNGFIFVQRFIERTTNEQATPSPTRFEFAQIQAEEGANAELRVGVIRSGGDLDAGTVRLRSEGGSALPGQHYWPIDTALEFEVGQTRASTMLRLIDDDAFTGDRTVNLLLDSPSKGLILDSPSSATVLVHDDELPTAAPLARIDRVTPVSVRGKLKSLTVSFRGELDSTQPIDATAIAQVRAGRDGRIGTSVDLRTERYSCCRLSPRNTESVNHEAWGLSHSKSDCYSRGM